MSLILHLSCQNFEICYLNVTSITSSCLLLSYQMYKVIIIVCLFLDILFCTFIFCRFLFSFLNPCLWSLLLLWEEAITADCSPEIWGRLSGHVVKCHLFTLKAHYSASFTNITVLSVCLLGICILEGCIVLSIPCNIVNQEMLLLGLCSLSFAFTIRFWRFFSLMFAHLLLLFSLFY